MVAKLANPGNSSGVIKLLVPQSRIVGLVQRTLERRWDGALQEVRRLEEEYTRFRQTQPTTLTSHEVEQIRQLARDLPALWDAPTTTPADRQQVIRFLVERVEVEIEGVSDQVRVTITWAGGRHTRHELIRPVGRYQQTTDFERVISCIGELRAAGQSFPVIADRLNREGFRPPNRAVRFGKDIVRRLVWKHMSCDRIHPGRLMPAWLGTNGS